MKILFTTILLSISLTSFAGQLDVTCGEIIKVKEKTKALVPGLGLVLGRLPALKFKLKNATQFIDAGFGITGGERKTFKHKYSFSDTSNMNKILELTKNALSEKKRLGIPVYVCIGEVTGLDRWHKVASSSAISAEDAYLKLKQKY